MPGGARPVGRSLPESGSAPVKPRLMAEAALPRILLVDDDPDISRLVQHVLASNGLGPAAHVTTGREALDSCRSADIVLLDHRPRP
jgi:PleD family two-component response regulator